MPLGDDRGDYHPAMHIAALLHDGSTDMDALLADTVAQLRTRGLRVRGLLMEWPDGAAACGAMVMRDIESGESYLVSQDLGPGATGCRADPAGFARAGGALRRALAETPPPDLVVLNRFGSLEAEGQGMADELLALLAAEVPVLTVVSGKQAEAWERFSGGVPRMPVAALPDWLAALPAA